VLPKKMLQREMPASQKRDKDLDKEKEVKDLYRKNLLMDHRLQLLEKTQRKCLQISKL
jgi:hypothetical protein